MRVSQARVGAGAALAVALISNPLASLVASAQAPTASPAALAPRERPTELTIFTSYPSIVADPGEDAVFPLTVDSPEAERVDLALGEAPEGFVPTFRGGGAIVQSVYTGGEVPPELELSVSVPEDAQPGDHHVVVSATAPSGPAELELDIIVGDVSAGDVSLTSDFPNLRGTSEDTFAFDLDLSNDTSQSIDFSLEGQGPEGWTVTVQPSTEEQAATVQVAAGDTEGIRASVTPAFQAEAGVYPILVRAVGGDREAQAELNVEVTGTFGMDLTTPDGRLNTTATAGSSTQLPIVLVNTGSAPLTAVSLSASPPRDWEVTFEPEEVQTVGIGEQADIVATITPAGNAVAGDYVVTLSARSDDADDEMAIRTTVETSTIWGIVGIALIGLVLVGLALVFWRFGRR
jgi:uncharacterized membrane protein